MGHYAAEKANPALPIPITKRNVGLASPVEESRRKITTPMAAIGNSTRRRMSKPTL
jgi:hypothetical protein